MFDDFFDYDVIDDDEEFDDNDNFCWADEAYEDLYNFFNMADNFSS